MVTKLDSAGDASSSGALSQEGDYTLPTKPWRRAATPWSEIVSHTYPGEGTDAKPFAVDWVPSREGFVDVENPQRFSSTLMWTYTMIAAFLTLVVSMGSSMLSAAIPEVVLDFPGYPAAVYILVTSAFVAGFVVGPLLWAPLSELYGRRRIFVLTFPLHTVFNALVCASTNIQMFIVLRFFAGVFGASAMTNSGGVIADMFSAEQRGLALAVFAAAPFMGPAIGPVGGGFLGEYRGWKWVAALVAFLTFAMTIAGSFIPETYGPVLLRERAARLSKHTGKVYRFKMDMATPMKSSAVFRKALQKPWGLLFKEPIVAVFAGYFSVVYALLYMQFTSFPIVFQQVRGWKSSIAGLAFLGITVGAMGSLLVIIFWENPRYARLSKAAGGYLPPEQRLISAMFGAWIMPAGLLVFAWTGAPKTIHWIVPVLATVPYGSGLVFVFLGGSNYLVDSYLMYAASVLAGNTVCRSILGVIFPLFTKSIFNTLGVNWAGTLVAGLSFLFAPVPIILYMYGERIRRSSKVSREADDLGKMMAQMMKQQMAASQKPEINMVTNLAPDVSVLPADEAVEEEVYDLEKERMV